MLVNNSSARQEQQMGLCFICHSVGCLYTEAAWGHFKSVAADTAPHRPVSNMFGSFMATEHAERTIIAVQTLPVLLCAEGTPAGLPVYSISCKSRCWHERMKLAKTPLACSKHE